MGAGNSWAAASLERLLMRQIPGCEGYGHLSSFHHWRDRQTDGRAQRDTERKDPKSHSLCKTRSEMEEAAQLGGSRAVPSHTRDHPSTSSLSPFSDPLISGLPQGSKSLSLQFSFYFYYFIISFIYFWLRWVFIAVHGLLIAVASLVAEHWF